MAALSERKKGTRGVNINRIRNKLGESNGQRQKEEEEEKSLGDGLKRSEEDLR